MLKIQLDVSFYWINVIERGGFSKITEKSFLASLSHFYYSAIGPFSLIGQIKSLKIGCVKIQTIREDKNVCT